MIQRDTYGAGRQTPRPVSYDAGFTLLELIVSLVLLGIMGAMLATFGSKIMTSSVQPAIQTQQIYNLQQVMENITIDYKNFILEEKQALCKLATKASQAETAGYGSYSAQIRFLKSTQLEDGSSKFIVTGTTSQNCATAPLSESSILEITLFPAGASQGVNISSLFTVPNT